MKAHALWTRFGVELEYMIVDTATLDVRPVADQLLNDEIGSFDEDVRRGPIEWSNELALHVIELKTARPAPRLTGLEDRFHREIRHINRRLARRGCRLMPGGMHPWMRPQIEGRLWPHAYREVYRAFHRAFNCRRHGWMNLQSTHLNLPFANDKEFARLHAAVRLVLPLLPALGASSPFVCGRATGNLDHRLEVYRKNCRRIPSVTGKVIPEPVCTRRAYEEVILDRIYHDLEPADPKRILREEWVNARGAIARFERNTIEIRLLDMQECPAADLAILEFLVAVVRHLVTQGPLRPQLNIPTEYLHSLLLRTIQDGGAVSIASGAYLKVLGLRTGRRPTVREIWEEWIDRFISTEIRRSEIIRVILREGTLAERLRRAVGPRPSRHRLLGVYRQLSECLGSNELFHG